MSDKSYTISQLSKQFGVTPRTIRHYEEKGLLSPHRNGLVRLYNARDRARLGWVLRGRRMGFTLEELRQWLDLYDVTDGGKNRLRAARAGLTERLAKLTEQRRVIEETIAELLKARDEIDRRLGAPDRPEDRRRAVALGLGPVTEPT